MYRPTLIRPSARDLHAPANTATPESPRLDAVGPETPEPFNRGAGERGGGGGSERARERRESISAAGARLRHGLPLPRFASAGEQLQALLQEKPRTPVQQHDVEEPYTEDKPIGDPLSAGRLALLPGRTAAALSRAAALTVLPWRLVDELWQALQENTAELRGHWRFVRNDMHDPNLMPLDRSGNERKRYVLPRYAAPGGYPGIAAGAGAWATSAGAVAPAEIPGAVASRLSAAAAPGLSAATEIGLVQQTGIEDVPRSEIFNGRHYLHGNLLELECGRTLLGMHRPVREELPGFFKLLLQHQVALVVDLTRESENKLPHRYCALLPGVTIRPEGQNLSLTCETKSAAPGVNAVLESHSVSDGRSTHLLSRLRYAQWPKGGLIDAATLMALADRIEATSPDPDRPIIVHCLPGLGRSDTVLAFIAASRRIAREVADNHGVVNPEIMLRHLLTVVAAGRRDKGPDFVPTGQHFTLLATALFRQFARYLPDGANGVSPARNRSASPPASVHTAAVAMADTDAALEVLATPPAASPHLAGKSA